MTSPDDDAYIRGAGVVSVGGERLRRVLVLLALATLGVLAVVLTVDAARSAVTIHRLQTRGETVQVTVTGCLGLASGTGMTPVGYTCRGSFTLQGHQYNAVIKGTSQLHPVGDVLTGVVAPTAPTVVATPEYVRSATRPGQRFVLPAILFALFLIGALWASRGLGPWVTRR